MSDAQHQETVKDLLSLLCTRCEQLSWKKRCLYTNGIDKSIMEIQVYQHSPVEGIGAQQICRFAYDPFSGKVAQMKYRSRYYHQPGDVVDVLLDLINTESKEVLS
jgi:hypothetical protein